MAEELVDARLHALTRIQCPTCRRPTAEGTGRLRESTTPSQWLLEVTCRRCHQSAWLWRPEAEALVRQVVRDHRVARGQASSATIAGELGDDGSIRRAPIVAVDEDAVALRWRLRESASTLASASKRDFTLEVDVDGGLTHRECVDGRTRSVGIRRGVDDRAVAAAFEALLTRVNFPGLPALAGEGEQRFEIDRITPAMRRTIRCNLRGETRDFAGATVSRAVVELVDGLWHLVEWIDAGGPAPRWPIAPAIELFPRVDALLYGVRAVRLTATRDWIGSQADIRRRELWIHETGEAELRVIRCDGPAPILESTQSRRPPGVDAIFDRIDALLEAGVRPQIGHVRSQSGLDTTHSHTLAIFDGARALTVGLVFGTERGLGVDYGDVPPRPAEMAAFEALWQAMSALGG